MNRQIRRLGAGLIVCYLALFAMLNYWQVLEAEDLAENPDNTRTVLRDFNRPRGTIETADGVLLARTVETGDETFPYQREYFEGARYGHLLGWFSLNLGSAGLERQYNDELSGQTFEQEIRSFQDLFVDYDPTGDLILSLQDSVQQVAEQQLGQREGSVVALDPRSGEVLALWSYPSYDPNLLSTHDFEAATRAKQLLEGVPGDPLRAHTFQERYFPGSTFKVVTSAAGLDSGRVSPTEPSYPVATEYVPPLTSIPVTNFGGSACGGTLLPILQQSCNTAFAEMAAETLGPEIMVDGAERFGFNDTAPIDLPGAVPSVFPTDYVQNLAALAQAGIGQYDVQATPLQMALCAAAVANGGEIMEPTVMREIRDSGGRVIESADPEVWRRALEPDDAAELREAMVSVVESGSASGMAISGMVVGGKTGTAEVGSDTDDTHAWIIGFAGPPGEVPWVAVAVFVKAQPGAGTQTGGTVAAPIARAVLEAALAVVGSSGATDGLVTTSTSLAPATAPVPAPTTGLPPVAPTTAAPATAVETVPTIPATTAAPSTTGAAPTSGPGP